MSRYTAVEVLTSRHDRSQFDCGHPKINMYLRERAGQAQKQRVAQTFVVCLSGAEQVVGFYSLVAGDARQGAAPKSLLRGAGTHNIPVAVLTRLGVDCSEQGKGLGQALLKDAILKSLKAADSLGIAALTIHAKDPELAEWYKSFDFVESPTDQLHLWLPMKTIAAQIVNANQSSAD